MNKETLDKLLKANPVDPRFSLRDHEKSRSDVWCMFQLVFFENKQLSYAQCKECKNILSYSGKIGTASLLRHKCYIIKHFTPREHLRSRPRSPLLKSSTLFPMGLDRTVPASRISSLAHDQIAFVTRDLQPFSVMEGEGFKALAQALINLGADYGKQDIENVLTLRKGLVKTLLPAVYSDIKREIREILENKNVSFAVDVWPDDASTRYILILTAHLLDNFKIRNIFLGTRELHEKAPNSIRDKVLDIIGDYIGKKLALQVLVEGKIVIPDDPEVSAAFDSTTSIPSACHNLNTVLDEVFRSQSEQLSSTIAVCNKLCQYFNNTGLNRSLAKSLINANCSHWDSVYIMIDSITRNYPQIVDLLKENGDRNMLEEINIYCLGPTLSSLKAFLEVFKECTESLNSSDKPTLNEVILWRFKILNLLSANEHDSDFIKDLKEKTRRLFDENFNLHELHYMAVFMNPDFKGMKFLKAAEKQVVIDKISEMIKADVVEDVQFESATKKRKLCKDDRFAEFRDNTNEDESHLSEIGQYINYKNSELDILDFWRKATAFPRLQKLAMKTLNIPAATMCAGREFSAYQKILKNRGNGFLSDDHDMVLLLHVNSSYQNTSPLNDSKL